MYKKIKSQFLKAKSTDDYVCKFNLLWISFNGFYNIKISNSNTDREKINLIKQDEDIKKIFNRLDNNIKDSFFNFINNRRYGNGGVKDLKNDNIIKYLNKDNFSEFLEIIYTIRNNQFHGGKDYNEQSDLEILKQASIIFEKFLEELYKEFGILTTNNA